MYKYCVRNLETNEYLNTSGKWSKNIFSWDVQFFDTKDLAEKAFVLNIKCDVTRVGDRK